MYQVRNNLIKKENYVNMFHEKKIIFSKFRKMALMIKKTFLN